MANSDSGDSKVGLIRGRSLSDIFRAVFPSHDVAFKNSSEVLSSITNNNENNPFESLQEQHAVTSSSNNPIIKTQSLTSLYNIFHFGYGSHSVLSDSQTSLSRTQSSEDIDIVDTSSTSSSSSKPIIISAKRNLYVPKMETIPGSPNMGDGFPSVPPQKQECKKTSLLERLVRTEKFTLNNQEINAFAPTSQ